MPCVDHQAHGYGRAHDDSGGGHKSRHDGEHVVGLPQQQCPKHASRNKDHEDARPDVLRRRRRGCGRPGGDVGDERGEIGMGLRGGRLVHPRVVFILSQPTLPERGLEGADHVHAIEVGGA